MLGCGLRRVCLLAAAQVLATVTAFAQTPVVRFSVLESGTVNWELDTIKHYGLDTANGFEMEVQGVAGGSAAQVAFQGGTADVIVSDWIWVARQRAAGRDYVFLPYSKAVGGLLLPPGSGADSIADLRGGKIGIAGGPLDKSWLILRAYATQQHGFDLAESTEQVYGAPPLIFKAALDGDLAGALNYWHFMARMKTAGMRELISVNEAAQAMGLDPDIPLLGYVLKGDMVRDRPELVAAIAAASRAAKDLLASDAAAWDRLRPLVRPGTDAEFDALKEGFLAGIPPERPVSEDAAGRFFELMAQLGGKDLVGDATSLPPGVFVDLQD